MPSSLDLLPHIWDQAENLVKRKKSIIFSIQKNLHKTYFWRHDNDDNDTHLNGLIVTIAEHFHSYPGCIYAEWSYSD
jgi:hypothetical protein